MTNKTIEAHAMTPEEQREAIALLTRWRTTTNDASLCDATDALLAAMRPADPVKVLDEFFATHTADVWAAPRNAWQAVRPRLAAQPMSEQEIRDDEARLVAHALRHDLWQHGPIGRADENVRADYAHPIERFEHRAGRHRVRS